LYECGWNLLGVIVLLVLDRRFRIKPPGLFALYVAWYTFGRTFEELLRIDPSHELLGQRLNFWVSAVLFVLAILVFVWAQRRPAPGERPRRPAAVEPSGPRMAIPKGRIRHGR
jgi:prolipoprotein diacylglyceryltransferase